MTIAIDTLTDLSFDTERGIAQEAVREARISVSNRTDWPNLVELVLAQLDAAGLGQQSAFGASFPDLVLVNRSVRLVRGQQRYVTATLQYKRKRKNRIEWSGQVRTKTVKRRTDKDGNPLKLKYTFPDDYKEDKSLQGQQRTKGVEIPTTKVLSSQTGRIVLAASNPGTLAQQWVNHVNSVQWGNDDKRTWKVTGADIEPFDLSQSPPEYELAIEITHDPDGWDQVATFIDPNTNAPPPDITQDQIAKNDAPAIKPEFLPERDLQNLPT